MEPLNDSVPRYGGVQYTIDPDKAVFVLDSSENSDHSKIKIFLPPRHAEQLIQNAGALDAYVQDSIRIYKHFHTTYPDKDIVLKESNDKWVALIPKKGFISAVERLFSRLFGWVPDKGYQQESMLNSADFKQFVGYRLSSETESAIEFHPEDALSNVSDATFEKFTNFALDPPKGTLEDLHAILTQLTPSAIALSDLPASTILQAKRNIEKLFKSQMDIDSPERMEDLNTLRKLTLAFFQQTSVSKEILETEMTYQRQLAAILGAAYPLNQQEAAHIEMPYDSNHPPKVNVFQKLAAAGIVSPESAAEAQIAYQKALDESIQFTRHIRTEGFLNAFHRLQLDVVPPVITAVEKMQHVNRAKLDEYLAFRRNHAGRSLDDFLITPIQRGARYELLCRELHKSLIDPEEKENFSAVLESVRAQNAENNAQLRNR